MLIVCWNDTLLIILGYIILIDFTYLHFFKTMATEKFKITHIACVVFLLRNTSLKGCGCLVVLMVVGGHFSTMNWCCLSKLKRFPLWKEVKVPIPNSIFLWEEPESLPEPAESHPPPPRLAPRPRLRNHKVSTALSRGLQAAWQSWRGTSLGEEREDQKFQDLVHAH